MPAGGHHSGSMYEYGKSVALDGAVTRVRWVNPHVYFEILRGDEKKQDDPWVACTGMDRHIRSMHRHGQAHKIIICWALN